MFKATITGVKAIDKALRDLEPKLAKKALRRGMRAGLKIMLQRVRELAPVGPSRVLGSRGGVQHQGGELKRKTKIKTARTRKGIRLSILVGRGDFTGETFYASFVNEGTKRIRARRYMEQAFNETKDQVREVAISTVQQEVNAIRSAN